MKIEGFASKTTKDGGCLVTVDGKELPLKPSQKLRNHSPTGFCWGYSGSGPAQLALALLLHAGIPKEDALDLYQDFKARHISGLTNGKDFVVDIDIQAWVLGIKSARRIIQKSDKR